VLDACPGNAHLPRDLYDDGRHYDLLLPGPNDLPFYRGQVERWGELVLELGCGTGRLTVPLAADGIDVTGLDSAAAMLEVAAQKAQQSGVAVQFVKADCRNFSLGRQFRLILFPNNSLSHLLTRFDVEACFACVRQHLAPGGRFIVDLFTPSLKILTQNPAQHYPVGQYQDPDGRGLITVTETTRYNCATQVNHITWHYQLEGESEVSRVPLNLRMFYPQEIDALLAYNGFVIDQKYGDYEETPYGSNSPKQLIVCRV
jgi:SAM-dependent methyltransferase